MLAIKNVTYRIAGRTLLDNASLLVNAGYRVGLVGPNGTGKSTLFNLITGSIDVDGGEIAIIPRTKLGMVRQDLPDDETTLIDIVLAADTERAALLEEAETATDPQRIVDIYTELNDMGAYEAPARAASILAGLGFNDEAQNSPINSFSGGWRMRVALAAALFRQPDLLLLDEPTNHLDFEAIIWLENYLINYKGTFIIISHDREILNKTVTHIAHLDQLKLEMYTGNYDQFEIRRSQKLMNQQAMFEKQQAHKARMLDFVRKFGAKASKASQAQSRLKMIEKMDMVDAIIAERSTKFIFPQPEDIGSPIINLRHVDIGYAVGKPILKDVDLRIDMNDRIGLLGANGNGKSTFIKLLSRKLEALKGDVDIDSKLRIGYFAQHQSEEMDVSLTPYETMREAIPNVPEHNIRAMLGKFGFDKGKADTKIEELSGGEKARLLFCMMSYNAPHIMLLDEPTNHLDIDARAALIQALNNYEGCVILVSHDPHLLESVVDQLWLVKDAAVTNFAGDLEDYKALVVEQRRREKSGAKKEKIENRKLDKKNKKEKPASLNLLAKAEENLAKWAQEKEEIEQEMTTPKAINKPDYMNELVEKYKIATEELEKAEKDWLEAQQEEAQ
ncbi:MAG TPA: glycosyl transferase family 1 [Alphaproteobacteria bacterium]|nr:glycosyl transferase family 1 [Alphaproteobacteria bacterium]